LPRDERLFSERTLKEAVHELGHTYGLEHCPDPTCVMHFSNRLGDTDVKSWEFCPKCQQKVNKIQQV
jgi:archaemetzincin